MPNKKAKGLNFEIIASNLSEAAGELQRLRKHASADDLSVGGAAGGATPCLPSSQFRLEHQERTHRAIREADAKTI